MMKKLIELSIRRLVMTKLECTACGAPLKPSLTLLRCPYCATLYNNPPKKEISKYNIKITNGGNITNGPIVIGDGNLVVHGDFVGIDKVTYIRRI